MAIGGSHVRHAGALHHSSCRASAGHHIDIGAAWERAARSAHGELLRVVHHMLLLLLLLRLLLLRLLLLLLLLRLLRRLVGIRTLALHLRVLRRWGAIGEAIVAGVHGKSRCLAHVALGEKIRDGRTCAGAEAGAGAGAGTSSST